MEKRRACPSRHGASAGTRARTPARTYAVSRRAARPAPREAEKPVAAEAVRGSRRKKTLLAKMEAFWDAPFRAPGKKRPRGKRKRAALQKKALFGLGLLAVFFLFTRIVSGFGNGGVSAETAAQMRIPFRAVSQIRDVSGKYGLSFGELLAVFALDNRFDPKLLAVRDPAVFEKEYILNYTAIKNRLSEKALAPYVFLFDSLFAEIAAFPVENGGGPGNAMYGNRPVTAYRYAEIVTRENVLVGLPVVSMTAGIVESAGKDAKNGGYLAVRSARGNVYFYSLLAEAPAFSPGMSVSPGDAVGKMSLAGSGAGPHPAAVRIGVGVPWDGKILWVNPYIFLRLVESNP